MTQFTYRGIQFEADSAAIETTDLGISGTYRGSKTAFRQPLPRSIDSALALRYRGKYYLRSAAALSH